MSPSWDQLAPLSVAPFAGPDDILSPLRWTSTHLHRCRTTQGSLADVFLLLSHCYTVGSVARGDVLIAIKDLNARVQNDTEVWGEILEKHGETVCNERAGSCFSSGMRTT